MLSNSMSSLFRRNKRKNDSTNNYAIKARRKYQRYPRRTVPYGPRPRQFHFPLYFADQPMRKYARLKYSVVQTTPTFTAGNIALIEYGANCMYDPEIAFGGHQPYGFDQMMVQYKYYTVISSTITAEMLINDTNQNQQWRLFVYPVTGTPLAAFAAGQLNGLLELPIQSAGVGKVAGDHLESARTIKTGAYMPKYAGKTTAGLIGESEWSGTDSTNPSRIVYYGLVGWEPALGAGAATQIKITLTFNCVLTEPKFFTTS